MNTLFRHRRSASRGLTLIELVVVLAILVALAGLIIGNFPGLIRRASRSTGATSIGDLNRAVQMEYMTQLRYPTGMDSLVDGSGNLFARLPTNSVGIVGGMLFAADLGAAEAGALVAAGINKTYQMDNPSTDVTWESTSSGTVRFNGGALVKAVAEMSAANAVTVFKTNVVNTSAIASRYFVFGLGSRCSLVGPSKVMFEAPVRFGESAGHNPKDAYQRYALVFAFDVLTGGELKVRYVGAAAIEDGGLSTSDDNLGQYWQN